MNLSRDGFVAAARRVIASVGLPRLIIGGFLACLFMIAHSQGLPTSLLLSDSLVRAGMNGVLVLALVPMIQAGAGLNFGLPVGIVCGLVGALVAMQFNIRGFAGFGVALAVAIPLAAGAGYLYGLLLNRVKGQEMMVGTYVGFSVVAGMCMFWLLAPFSNPEMIWVIGGKGLRVTLTLDKHFAHVLNNVLTFDLFGLRLSGGLLGTFLLLCALMRLFFMTKMGMAMVAAGSNPMFALSSGINVDAMRVTAVVISTVLGAIGILIYAQSFGFLQLYLAPLMMAFPAVAAILIGGASTRRASVLHVVLGTFLFQTLLTVALPVTSAVIAGSVSEVARIIVSNGMILYALTRGAGRE